MTDNKRNRPNGDHVNGNRSSIETGDNRKRYEEFGGMNYEQVRQPYNPQRQHGNGNSGDGGGNAKVNKEK